MKERKRSSFIGFAIAGIVELAVMNTVPLWLGSTGGVVKDSFPGILWAINVSVAIRIAINAYLAYRRPARLYLALQSLSALASLLAMIAFLAVFPVDFGRIGAGWLDGVARGFTIFGLAMGGLAAIVNGVRAAKGEEYADK